MQHCRWVVMRVTIATIVVKMSTAPTVRPNPLLQHDLLYNNNNANTHDAKSDATITKDQHGSLPAITFTM